MRLAEAMDPLVRGEGERGIISFHCKQGGSIFFIRKGYVGETSDNCPQWSYGASDLE